jgi:hypothetical protein
MYSSGGLTLGQCFSVAKIIGFGPMNHILYSNYAESMWMWWALNRYLAERLKYPTGRNGYGESNHQRAT